MPLITVRIPEGGLSQRRKELMIKKITDAVVEAEGYEVDAVSRGDDADTRLRETAPDLIVLDWMLPGLSGIELCRRLRTRPQTQALPIIMLTARGEESERIRGLATGADDYIVKPFSVPELLARIRALLRRAKPERVAEVLSAGDIELDREKKRVSRDGREVALGPTEFRLLEFLMQSPGRVFSREQLLNGVWGRDIYIDERTVDVHVGRLRKGLNRGLVASSLVIGVLCFAAIRQQWLVGDREFLRSMIPHHAGAILMCGRAPVKDPEIRSLCATIIKGQQQEIDQMSAMLAPLR